VSRVHSQSCHSVQGPFTILSFCPGPIHNLVIVSRGSFTILSFCLGFIHNLVIVSRIHSQSCHSIQGPFTITVAWQLLGWTAFLGVWEINNLATLLGSDRSGRSRISSGLFIASTVPDLTWWQCSLSCCQLGAAVGCHSTFSLLIYYIGYVGHISGGIHEYLDAFWGSVSHIIQIFISPALVAGCIQKKRSKHIYPVLVNMYVHVYIE
jgi:hypothetical protein